MNLSFHPPPLSEEVIGGSKGQLARVLSLSPPPPNLNDHQTAGYKGWADFKLEHSHVILRGEAVTLHLFLPVSFGKIITIIPLCIVISLLTVQYSTVQYSTVRQRVNTWIASPVAPPPTV